MADWKAKKRIEKGYIKALKEVSKQMNIAIGNSDNPDVILRRLKQLTTQKTYHEFCEKLALTMTTQLNSSLNSTWRQTAAVSSKGQEIYKSLKDLIKAGDIGWQFALKVYENAEDIKTVPLKIAHDMTELVQRRTMEGVRASDIAKELKTKIPENSNARAETIARTEVSRTQSALVRARSESLGIKCYIWRTSKDNRVRRAHDVMDGGIVFWNDPPSPEALAGERHTYGRYHAGEIFNCRCYAEPVVDVKFIKFPCKVYRQGSIIKINSMKEFERAVA